MDSNQHWHYRDKETVFRAFQVKPSHGLSSDEAALRLQTYGLNQLEARESRSFIRILLTQLADFMIIVLLIAALIAGLTGDFTDSIIILLILVLNTAIGASQELRAEKAISALQALSAPVCHVRRNGQVMVLAASELVPGDIVALEAGIQVPADLRLLETSALAIDESTLTGESAAVLKHHEVLGEGTGDSIGDRLNMVFKGTLVTNGRGLGLVVATGMHTELGKIATLLESTSDTKTPLQGRLSVFSRRLAISILLICAFIFASGLLRGEEILLMLLTSISLAVAAIPESLPAVVTIALAIGASRLAGVKALMRNLKSVETLGSITWICSDKTGTLTENRMHVEQFVPATSNPDLKSHALAAMVLCNDATTDAEGLKGDPTETAILQAAMEAGVDIAELRSTRPRILEWPFDSNRMRMTTAHQSDNGYIAYTKGAPESMLTSCTGYFGSEQPWDPEVIQQDVAKLAENGMRVLLLACRNWAGLPGPPAAETVETNLQYLGLLALLDPPRQEARNAIAACTTAGITPVMITGDHPATALAIAKRLDIANTTTQLITGAELNRMDETGLEQRIGSLRVFARMDPAQKIRIVTALQKKGELVAMTGDGVNDAPALKKADIGVAMGRNGTDVARESSDMILLDDNFATIVNAIAGGRRIYDNIRRFIRYVLTTNLAEVLIIFLAPFLGLPLPLLPVQILWVNLVTDGLPGLALTSEQAELDIMHRKPRPPGETIFAGGLWQHLLWVGAFMSVVVLGLQYLALESGNNNWQTLVFTTLTFSQLFHVIAIRSDHDSLFRIGLLSNLPLLASVILTIILQLLLIYVPALNPVFNTSPLSGTELALCCILSFLVLLVVELEKILIRQGWLYASSKVE